MVDLNSNDYTSRILVDLNPNGMVWIHLEICLEIPFLFMSCMHMMIHILEGLLD